MKFKKYEKPELEDIELLLEGSFLIDGSKAPEGEVGGEIGDGPGGGTEGDDWD